MIKSADDIPFVFDCKKLAEILDVSESTARTIMHSPGFPVRSVSPRKHRVYKGEFLDWLQGKSSPAG